MSTAQIIGLFLVFGTFALLFLSGWMLWNDIKKNP